MAWIQVPVTELEARWGCHFDSFQDRDFPFIRWSLRGWAPTARTEFVCSTIEAGTHMGSLYVPTGAGPMDALLGDLQLLAEAAERGNGDAAIALGGIRRWHP